MVAAKCVGSFRRCPCEYRVHFEVTRNTDHPTLDWKEELERWLKPFLDRLTANDGSNGVCLKPGSISNCFR